MYQFFEVAINELTDRFRRRAHIQQYSRFEEVHLSGSIDNSAYSLLTPHSESVWKMTAVQMPLFCKQQYTNVTKTVRVLQSMSTETQGVFSKVMMLVRLLVSSASSSEAERSFSALRRSKTWLQIECRKRGLMILLFVTYIKTL